MAAKTIDELLAGVPLFAGLSKSDLRKVGSLASRVNIPTGSKLAHQGKVGREFLVVLDGTVDVLIDGEVVATCGAGEFFGEIALLEHGERTATVVATTDVVVDVINQAEFSTLLDDHPEIGDTLRVAMEQRLSDNAAHQGDAGDTTP
jgi:CRP/FNR family cyclic AMP-dependent transcriptional regulator